MMENKNAQLIELDQNRTTLGIAVAVLSEDPERKVLLQGMVESTKIARVVLAHVGFPLSPGAPILRQLQDQHAEIVLVDVSNDDPQRAIRAIELIRVATRDTAIFAIGELTRPTIIVGAMRAGAGEFVDRMAGTDGLLEAFTRYSAARNRAPSTSKGRVFTVLNAKGGADATTVAVNLAIALQQNHGRTILVDFAPIGHAALHLNAGPTFTLIDALQNFHRMDETQFGRCRLRRHLE
jgi:pilus assembly protein CpaE